MSDTERANLWHAVMDYVKAYHQCREPGSPVEEVRFEKWGVQDVKVMVPRSDDAYLASCRAYNRVEQLIWDRSRFCWWKPWTWFR